MAGLAEEARKKGKLTPKMQKQMNEIEAMMENLNSFGDNVIKGLEKKSI